MVLYCIDHLSFCPTTCHALHDQLPGSFLPCFQFSSGNGKCSLETEMFCCNKMNMGIHIFKWTRGIGVKAAALIVVNYM